MQRWSVSRGLTHSDQTHMQQMEKSHVNLMTKLKNEDGSRPNGCLGTLISASSPVEWIIYTWNYIFIIYLPGRHLDSEQRDGCNHPRIFKEPEDHSGYLVREASPLHGAGATETTLFLWPFPIFHESVSSLLLFIYNIYTHVLFFGKKPLIKHLTSWLQVPSWCGFSKVYLSKFWKTFFDVRVFALPEAQQ